MDDLQVKQVISFIFKRSGKKKMKDSDIYLTLSMELNWCPPHAAKSFVIEIEKTSLIMKENEFIEPAFDIDKISIPIDFKPSVEFFTEYKAEVNDSRHNTIKSLIDLIQLQSHLSKEEVQSRIQNIQQQKNIKKNIALLMFAKQQGIDINAYASSIEKELFIKNKE